MRGWLGCGGRNDSPPPHTHTAHQHVTLLFVLNQPVFFSKKYPSLIAQGIQWTYHLVWLPDGQRVVAFSNVGNMRPLVVGAVQVPKMYINLPNSWLFCRKVNISYMTGLKCWQMCQHKATPRASQVCRTPFCLEIHFVSRWAVCSEMPLPDAFIQVYSRGEGYNLCDHWDLSP